MRRFHSPGHVGRFCHAHDLIYEHFRLRQHQLTAADHRATLTDRHESWNEITVVLLTEQAAAA